MRKTDYRAGRDMSDSAKAACRLQRQAQPPASRQVCREAGASTETSLMRSPLILMLSLSITLAWPEMLFADTGPEMVQHKLKAARKLL